jgi:hypothetical protein
MTIHSPSDAAAPAVEMMLRTLCGDPRSAIRGALIALESSLGHLDIDAAFLPAGTQADAVRSAISDGDGDPAVLIAFA